MTPKTKGGGVKLPENSEEDKEEGRDKEPGGGTGDDGNPDDGNVGTETPGGGTGDTENPDDGEGGNGDSGSPDNGDGGAENPGGGTEDNGRLNDGNSGTEESGGGTEDSGNTDDGNSGTETSDDNNVVEPETHSDSAPEEDGGTEKAEETARVQDDALHVQSGVFVMPIYMSEPAEPAKPQTMERKAESIMLEGVTWQSEPVYDENVEGIYIFTAVLPDGYTPAEGLSLPQITVTVQGEDPVVQELLARIAALPEAEECLAEEPDVEEEDEYEVWMDELSAYAEEALAIWEAYETLTAAQQARIPAEALQKLTAWVELAEQLAESSQVMAAEDGWNDFGEGFTTKWKLEGDTLTISGSGDMPNWDASVSKAAPWSSERESIKTIIIDSGVENIGSYAIDQCGNLERIEIADTVKSIGGSAFRSCRSLKNITIPDGVTQISSTTFFGCNSLERIEIPDSVTSIGSIAFCGCVSLTGITIPKGVTSIGGDVFRSCEKLSSVTFTEGDSIPTLASGCFNDCYFVKKKTKGINVPSCKYLTGEGWSQYKDNVSKQHTMTHTDNGLVCSGCGMTYSETINAENCNVTTAVTGADYTVTFTPNSGYNVPTEVTVTIGSTTLGSGDYTYTTDSAAGTLMIPIGKITGDIAITATADGDGWNDFGEGYTTKWKLEGDTLTIGGSGPMPDWAAYNGMPWYKDRRSIKSITIGDNVTSIGDRAFDDCANLTSITIPGSVKKIGVAAFETCLCLSSVTISQDVTDMSIGDAAFRQCHALTSINIPAGVTSIGHNGFYGDELLSDVKFEGTTTIPTLGSFCFAGCPCVAEGTTRLDIPSCKYLTVSGWSQYKNNVNKQHNLTEKSVAATCTKDGVEAYWICEGDTGCGTMFSDAEGNTVITETVSIPATGHSLTYTNTAVTIRESCSNGCGHVSTVLFNTKQKEPYTYTGSAIQPFTVSRSNDVWLGTPSPSISYEKNVNVGEATATLSAGGKSVQKKFQIVAKSLEDALVTVTLPSDPYQYTGEAITPAVTVKDGSTTLENTDYTVTYANNTAVGTATVTVTGKGNYSGERSLTFTIQDKAPEVSKDDLDFSGGNVTLPDDIKDKVVIYDSEGNPITPNPDGSLPVEPGTTIKIKYPGSDKETVITMPPRPAAPASPDEGAIERDGTTITVPKPDDGKKYEFVLVEKGQEPDWSNANTTGVFEGTDPDKEYDLYMREAATKDNFASEPVKIEIGTSGTVPTPTPGGDGKDDPGNKVEAGTPTEDGKEVTYEGTCTEGYTPVITIGGKTYTPEITWNGDGTGTWTVTVPAPAAGDKPVVNFNTRKYEGLDIITGRLHIYADDSANEGAETLVTYLRVNCVVKAKYDNGTSDDVADNADYETQDSFAPGGGTYKYTVKAAGDTRTDAVILTVSSVTATVTAPQAVTKNCKAGGYTAAEVSGWLPEKVTVTYTGDGYTTRTADAAVTWDTASLGANFGETAGSKKIDGTVTLPGWAKGSGAASIGITFADKNVLTEGQMTLSVPGWAYGAKAAPQPAGSVTVADTDQKYTYQYSADNGATWVEAAALPKSKSGNIIPGAYMVKMTYTGKNYMGTKTATFTVAKKPLTAAKGTLAVESRNYDGTTNATLKAGGKPALSGVVGNDEVSLGGTLKAVFTNKGPKKDIPVTVTGFVLTGSDAGYYQLVNTTLTLKATINKADGSAPSEGGSNTGGGSGSSGGSNTGGGSSSGGDNTGGGSSTGGGNTGNGSSSGGNTGGIGTTDKGGATGGKDSAGGTTGKGGAADGKGGTGTIGKGGAADGKGGTGTTGKGGAADGKGGTGATGKGGTGTTGKGGTADGKGGTGTTGKGGTGGTTGKGGATGGKDGASGTTGKGGTADGKGGTGTTGKGGAADGKDSTGMTGKDGTGATDKGGVDGGNAAAEQGGAQQTVKAAVEDGRVVIPDDAAVSGATGSLTEDDPTSTKLLVGDGTVVVTVVCEDERYTVGTSDAAAVANAVLTPEQIELANSGETLEVRVDIRDISGNMTPQDMAAVEKGYEAYGKYYPDLILGGYVDISVYMKTGDSGWSAVTETGEPLEIVIGIPEELRGDDRAYYIIRVHENRHTLLNDMDDNPDTITVLTDRFSSYVIAYRALGTASVNVKTADGRTVCGLCHICPTFLGTCCFVWLTVIVAVVFVVAVMFVVLLVVLRRRREVAKA